MEKSLFTSIRYLKGIGPKRAEAFNKLGINSIEDFLYYFPRRYEDRTNFISINKLEAGQSYTIKAEILACAERRSFRRRRFSILEIIVGDRTGKIFCVWFNQSYLKEYFQVGKTLILYGKVENYAKRIQMSAPEFEIVSDAFDESLNIGRIVPVYSLPERISQRNFRKMIKNALDEFLPKINDFLAFDIRSRNRLLNLAKSLINIHFPETLEARRQSYERLSFEEFLLFQLPLALRKRKEQERQGIIHKVEGGLTKDFIESLPFELTRAQKKVLDEIKQDMASPKVMQRLLQGDVGSGKTVVATITALFAIQGKYQAAFMAPTEILAKQHFEKISSQLCVNSLKNRKIKISLLVGSTRQKEKARIYQETKEGKIDLLIGTHSLLEEEVQFKNLGLVVIDEQHKFGVGQRSLLSKKGPRPDILIMTATPIPRTLAITLYGDLDLSVINELPPGRPSIKTMNFTQQQKSEAYNIAYEQLRQGNQAYIVYPVIEESYVLDIAGARTMYSELKKGKFKEFRLGLIHGRLKQEEQDTTMLKFKQKELDALVSTTVLEVGIDIPSATCMIVQNAERFGLSQLHQLRGRIGRGFKESFCLLISNASTEESKARLAAMVAYSDGFRIAEEDLKIRGPGEFFGKRQHGLTELKIGNPLTQMHILKQAREEAIRLVANDPHLEARSNILLKEKLLQRFPGHETLTMVG